jgi:NitT/TauT family transport system substrate-binding protein
MCDKGICWVCHGAYIVAISDVGFKISCDPNVSKLKQASMFMCLTLYTLLAENGSMAKIVIGIILVFLVAAGGYFFLNQNKSANNSQGSSILIKTAKTYWPGQFWKEVAYEKGWFREAGLNVELVDGNKDYYQSLKDAADGKIDSNDFPPYDFIQHISKGSEIVAVINTDVSSGIDAVVGSSKINTISDLKGKRVAVPKGTFGEYLLAIALERNGLMPSDVIQVDIQAEKTHEALLNGTVDAAVTYEPNISDTIQKIGAKRLFDTSEVLGINSGVEAFQKVFIKNHPQLVQKYVGVWRKTTLFIKDHPDEAYGIIAKNNNVTVDDVKELVKGDKILDLQDNKISFAYSSGYDSLPGGFKRLNRFMLENKHIDKMLDESKYFDSSFINNLE